MDIATITDVLDYVRKCSKLVNAFIIGIIRQTRPTMQKEAICVKTAVLRLAPLLTAL